MVASSNKYIVGLCRLYLIIQCLGMASSSKRALLQVLLLCVHVTQTATVLANRRYILQEVGGDQQCRVYHLLVKLTQHSTDTQ